MTWSLANQPKFVCQVNNSPHMSVVYLLLGGRDEIIKGIITPDGFHVFSIYDFMQIVLIGGKSRKYVTNLWDDVCRLHSHFMEVQGTLVLTVPSTKMPKREPTAGTTVAGLRGVLDVLGNRVSEACRKTVEDIFARYTAGNRSMIVEVNLNDKSYPQIPPFSYNLQPPTASAQEPVASMLIEDASRESSMSIEFDFTSTEDHIVREQA
jgi:hypothetical protein